MIGALILIAVALIIYVAPTLAYMSNPTQRTQGGNLNMDEDECSHQGMENQMQGMHQNGGCTQNHMGMDHGSMHG